MKPFSWDDGEGEEEEEVEEEEKREEPLADCDAAQRQRAHMSLKWSSLDGGEGEEPRGGNADHGAVASEDDGEGWSRKSQSEAVNHLKSLLMKQCKEIPQVLPPLEKQPPSKLAVSHHQLESVPPLEAKFGKEEVQGRKQRLRVVEAEKETLKSQLHKSRMTEGSLEDCAANRNNAAADDLKSSISKHKSEHLMWKNQMEHLRAMHQAQIEMLDGQVISLRRDLCVSQKECEEVKLCLKKKEKELADALRADRGPRVAGLCLKCVQHEAILERTHTTVHAKAVERLTKERDELVNALRAARAGQQEAQEKEWSTCLQVKQVVEVAEEACLHKARAEAQFEQLSRELLRHRQQAEREAHALKERLSQAREEGRSEAHKQKEELAQTVAQLSQQVAEYQTQQDRLLRDKGSLTKQLEDALNKLTNQEQDNAKVCVELRYELSQALLKKDEAERERRDLSTKMARQIEKAEQEVERLSSELVGCRQRLEAVQKDGSQWQAEALSLTEQLASAQRQLHLTRQSSLSAQQAHQEEVASLSLAAQERQKELTELLQRAEEQQQQRVSQTEALLRSQNGLIRKLRDECGALGLQLEEVTHSCRLDVQLLSAEKQQLEETAADLRARCSDMEGQCVQHGRLHQRMKTRLQQLDRHCQSSAQQVCELLAKQKQLMQERNTLTEEVHNLHTEGQVRFDSSLR